MRKVARIIHDFFFRYFWVKSGGSASTSKDFLHWLDITHRIIGYFDGVDRVPPHFLQVQIVFCTF